MSDKKEALLEKELVLEEVVSLTKKLRKQASDGRQETLQLSKKVTMGGPGMNARSIFDTNRNYIELQLFAHHPPPTLDGHIHICLFLCARWPVTRVVSI